jgi:AspBHI-like restriction endonuclease
VVTDIAKLSVGPVGNKGGFRYKGSPAAGNVRLVVLYTSGKDVDTVDEQTGVFMYHGDNKRPGRELHDTQRRGT